MPKTHSDSFITSIHDCGEEFEVAVEFTVKAHSGDRKQTELQPDALNSADSQHLPPGLYDRHEDEINDKCWDHLTRNHPH